MKLYSWNVNGIRAVWNKGLFQKFIEEHDPDILCLQETKSQPHQSPVDLPQYDEYWNSAEKAGYSGTAILARQTEALVEHFAALAGAGAGDAAQAAPRSSY